MAGIHVHNVNVASSPRKIAAKSGWSGIHKTPTDVPVAIGPAGIEGDTICDTENHGGPEQAVYVYCMADYRWWSVETGRSLPPGTFGENVTLEGIESAELHIGDRIRIGSVLLEINSPRIACVTLAERMKDPRFVKAFTQAKRPGAYCRVLHCGEIERGMPVQFEAYPGDRIPVANLVTPTRSMLPSQIDALLAAPVHAKMRQWLELQRPNPED